VALLGTVNGTPVGNHWPRASRNLNPALLSVDFWNKLSLLRTRREIFRDGRDAWLQIKEMMHSFWWSCDRGLRGTISLLLSTCQTYHKNIQENRLRYWGTSVFEDSLRVCFCLRCFGHDKNQKGLMIREKGKQKYLGSYCLLRRVKIRQRRTFRRPDKFLNRFHLLSITSKTVHYAFVNVVLCVARWRQNTVGVCFICTSVDSWRKMLQSGSRNGNDALL